MHLWLLDSHWNTGRSKIHLCICSTPTYPASKGTRKIVQGRWHPGRLPHHLSAENRHKELSQPYLRTTYIVKLNWSHTCYSSVWSVQTKEPVKKSWDLQFLFLSKPSLNSFLLHSNNKELFTNQKCTFVSTANKSGCGCLEIGRGCVSTKYFQF